MGSCVSQPERKIVLLGRTGDGKSSAGNTILGEKVFTAKTSENAEKVECEIKKARRYGRRITVIEMPGLFDKHHDDKTVKSEIIRGLVQCTPSVDAFVIVLKVRKYTEQEMKELNQHLKTLKGDVFDHMVILFTFGKKLEGQNIKKFLKANLQLKELVDKCEGRRHVIDNKHWKKRNRGFKSNKAQVKNLLKTIEEMRNKNGCYTNAVLQKLEEQIQQEIENDTENNLQPKEKREKAKKSVEHKMCKQAAGAVAGAFFGALLGVGVMLTSVLAFLQATFPLQALFHIASAVVGLGGKKAVTGEAAANEMTKKLIKTAADEGEKAGTVNEEEKAEEATVKGGVIFNNKTQKE